MREGRRWEWRSPLRRDRAPSVPDRPAVRSLPATRASVPAARDGCRWEPRRPARAASARSLPVEGNWSRARRKARTWGGLRRDRAARRNATRQRHAETPNRRRAAVRAAGAAALPRTEIHPQEIHPGEDRPGENRPGENRPGENRPGENRPGETSNWKRV